MSESIISYELIENILQYIKSLNQEGAILVFLPGWNTIFGLMKHLQNHPELGSGGYQILPLHSQIPREEQYKVFQEKNFKYFDNTLRRTNFSKSELNNPIFKSLKSVRLQVSRKLFYRRTLLKLLLPSTM